MSANTVQMSVAQRSSADVAEMVRCAHCTLPVPAGLINPAFGRDEQFCCHGCKTVYAVLRGCGLEKFYGLREADGAAPTAAKTTGRKYEEFDDAAFEALYVRAIPDGTRSVELVLEGVDCAACIWLLEKLPTVVRGVIEARLNLAHSMLEVTWDPQIVGLSRIARAVDSLGYPPHPARDAATRDIRREEDRKLLIRIGVAGAAAGNVMLFAFALYGGFFQGIDPEYLAFFRWFSMAIGVVCLAWPGSVFFRGAWAAIRTRSAHLDLPIALALAAGGIAGVWNTITGFGEIYFDSLTSLVFLLLVGRWIQRRQQRWATDAVELLHSLTPTAVRRVDPDGVRDVPIEAIELGDIVEVWAGETIPVDGVVESGQSTIDESLLTGESRPIDVAGEQGVCAGTTNLSSTLRIRAVATGSQTRVGKLMQLVERGTRQQAPVVRFNDRVAAWFTFIVLFAGLATFLLWVRVSPRIAIDNAASLLIVTCPCMLGLATPLIVTLAIGRSAKRGILVKGGEALEALARRGTLILDKTGTLTHGRMKVEAWHGSDDAKPLVAALEAHSAHPIARALVEAFADGGACARRIPLPVERVSQTIGGGIEGWVDGRRVIVGAPAFVQKRLQADILPASSFDRDAAAGRVSDSVVSNIDSVLGAAQTPILVAVDGAIVAVAGLGDPIRNDANVAIDEVRRLGWQVEILSGDHPLVATAVGQRLGIPPQDVRGGATPEIKLARVQSAATRGPVIMVGDGVNDAAALAAATVGIAVHGGAEASMAAADVYLRQPGLAPIVDLIHSGRHILRTVRRCLAVSLVYNLVGGALAITGVIHPLMAAIMMPLSSLSVTAMALSPMRRRSV